LTQVASGKGSASLSPKVIARLLWAGNVEVRRPTSGKVCALLTAACRAAVGSVASGRIDPHHD
jgi:hypothetical protein